MANQEHLDDFEQAEAVRTWLKQNASSIILGIVLGVALIGGWRWYDSRTLTHRAEAMLQFEELRKAEEASDADGVKKMAELLRDKYDDTPFAGLAALTQAEQALARGETEAATSALEWASRNANPESVRALAATRLARVQLAGNSADATLKTVEPLRNGAYAALVEEIRGDALLSLGKRDEARAAYQEALTRLPAGAATRSMVEMKLNELAVADNGTPAAKVES